MRTKSDHFPATAQGVTFFKTYTAGFLQSDIRKTACTIFQGRM